MEAKDIGGKFGLWASWLAPVTLFWLLHGLDRTEGRLVSLSGLLSLVGGSVFCLYAGRTLGRWVAPRVEGGIPWFKALGWGCAIGIAMAFAFGIAWAFAIALKAEHPHLAVIFSVTIVPILACWITVPYGIAVIFLLRWRLDIHI